MRARIEQLGAGDRQQQDRRVARPIGDVLDEVQHRRLGPLQVVDHHDERLRARQLLPGTCRTPQNVSSAGDRRSSERPISGAHPVQDRVASASSASKSRSSRTAASRRLIQLDARCRPARARSIGQKVMPVAVGQAAAAQHRWRRSRDARRRTHAPGATCRRRRRRCTRDQRHAGPLAHLRGTPASVEPARARGRDRPVASLAPAAVPSSAARR